MESRIATPNDLTALRSISATLHQDMEFDEQTSEQMLTVPVSKGQALIFEEGGKPVAYLTIALMSDDAARKYIENGEINFDVTGPNVWVIEYAGPDNRVAEAHRVMADHCRAVGKSEYRYFREKDNRVHVMKV